MAIPVTPLRHQDETAHRQVLAERINQVRDFTFDDSRTLTGGEITAAVTPTNKAFAPYSSKRLAVAGDGTDQATKLQAMLDSAVAASDTGSAAKSVIDSAGGSSIRSDVGLTFDCNKITLDGQGSTLNFENITTAFSGVKLAVAQADPNLAVLQNNARGLRNLVIQMPGHTVNTSGIGLHITNTGSGEPSAIRVDGVSVHGGAEGVRLDAVSWGLTFTGLVVIQQSTNTLGIGVRVNSSGGVEATKFFSALITGAQLYGVQCDLGDAKFIGSNIDGCATISYQLGTSHLQFSSCYFEFVEGDNTSFKFRVEDNNATLVMNDCDFVVRADVLATRTKELYNVSSGASLILRNIVFRGTVTSWYKGHGGYLAVGAGFVSASGVKWQDIQAAPLVHRSLQWLAYPDCDNPNVLAGWTLSNGGAANPVRVINVNDGSQTRDAVLFQINNGAPNGSFSRAVYTRSNLIAGRRITFCGDVYTGGTLAGSNVKLDVTFTFKDAAGNILSGPTTTIILNSADSNTWANGTFLVDAGNVQQGASSVDVQVQTISTAIVAGNTLVRLSPIGFGYPDGE